MAEESIYAGREMEFFHPTRKKETTHADGEKTLEYDGHKLTILSEERIGGGGFADTYEVLVEDRHGVSRVLLLRDFETCLE